MSRKEEFLRAIQSVDPGHPGDLALMFGWALNLREEAIPRDIGMAARDFSRQVSGARPAALIRNRKPRSGN